MLSYICTIFIPFLFCCFLFNAIHVGLYIWNALSNEQFPFVTFCKLFLSRKIFFDEIYAIINVFLIIHYYSTQYVMIKWKTLTLSCNCPLVTSFFIHRSFVLWTKFLIPSFRAHIVFKYTKNNVVIFYYICVYLCKLYKV